MTDDRGHEPPPADAEPPIVQLPLVDLTEFTFAEGDGAVWSLPHGGDLDANVVALRSGQEIGRHVNDEVDVLIVVWQGDGHLVVGNQGIDLRPGIVVSVARGLERSIWASTDLTYLSVHRRRGPLVIGSRH